MNSKSGTLYVIATPIGNLEDITFRAVKVLKKVDICAVEDTRRSRKLFNHFNIKTRLISYHKFSENRKVGYFINFLEKGKSIGLLSDAGTPLISDPGYPLIKKASEMDFNIVPIPGASALTTALSVSNLAIDKFTFYGFPPKRGKSRKKFIQMISKEEKTTVIFEAGNRLSELILELMEENPDRQLFVSRELTKLNETFYRGSLKEISKIIDSEKYGKKGEFVLILGGISKRKDIKELPEESLRILKVLLRKYPNNEALSLGAEILGIKKNILYKTIIKSK